MTEKIVKQWRVLCLEENKMVTVYSPDVPSLCPNDHPDRTIDHTRTTMIAHISTKKFQIENSTPGNFQHTTVLINVPSGSPGDIYVHDMSWPMDIYIWKTEFLPETKHKQDEISIMVAPNKVIGALTQDANIGDTELNVTSTVFDFSLLSKGVDAKLDDTVNSEEVGRITGIDPVNFKIHIENPLTQTFSAGTQFQINLCMIRNLIISQDIKTVKIGSKGFTSKFIPANTVLRLLYKNNNGQAKDVYFSMEFNYI